MAKIITAGRTDLKDFFEKSGNFDSGEKLDHTPFLVFLEEEDTIRVQIVKTVEELLSFPDETPVMEQWQGNYRSDFFQFTVGDYRHYVDEQKRRQEETLLTARNVVKRVATRSTSFLSYEYTAEQGHTVHGLAILRKEIEELEAFFNQHGIPIRTEYVD